MSVQVMCGACKAGIAPAPAESADEMIDRHMATAYAHDHNESLLRRMMLVTDEDQPACAEHEMMQYRDAKPAACDECGWSDGWEGQQPYRLRPTMAHLEEWDEIREAEQQRWRKSTFGRW
jgi:hypothetical protein